MAERSNNDSSQRIRDLEARVQVLSQELEAMRAERRASAQQGRRAGDPAPPLPPMRRRVWLARAMLLMLTLALTCAAYVTIREKLVAFNPREDVWRQLAGMSIDYPLLVLAVAGGLSFIAFLSRRLVLFLALALTCCYGGYGVYIANAGPYVPVGAVTYFWLTIFYLILCYGIASWLLIYESLRTGRGRRRVVLLALLNTAAFYPLLWLEIHANIPETAWLVLGALAVLTAFLAVLAESIGTYRNYMFQLFAATAILSVNAALQSVLSEEQMLIALAIECLALAGAYHGSGIVVLKVLNIFTLVATVALALRSTKLGIPIHMAGMTLRVNWVYGLTTCALLILAALYYDRHIRRLPPQKRRFSGHWFLADTFWDIPCQTVGLLHGAAAALIVIVLTIADYGERPSLPFLLASASLVFAALGLALRAPELEVSAVMLIVATHVSYYFFLAIGKVEFSDQPRFGLLTLAVTGYTYFAAFRWERYMRGLQSGHPWEHYFSAAVPYLVATAMALTLMERQLAPGYLAICQTAFGLALVISGAALADAAIKTSGVASVLVGTAYFLARLSLRTTAGEAGQSFWLVAGGMLLLLIATERVLLLGRHVERVQARTERFARSLLALLVGGTGLWAIRAGADDQSLPLLWVGLACACLILGSIFRENRYRWTAMAVIIAALAWEFGYERAPISDSGSIQLIAGAAVTSILVIVSWSLAMRSGAGNLKGPSLPGKGPSPHG